MRGKEERLSAVLIADHFNSCFGSSFSSLLPLCNVPLIDYVLEWLEALDVEDVFVVMVASPKLFHRFLLPVLNGCKSLGDAMRELDRRALLKSDFLLVQVVNFALSIHFLCRILSILSCRIQLLESRFKFLRRYFVRIRYRQMYSLQSEDTILAFGVIIAAHSLIFSSPVVTVYLLMLCLSFQQLARQT
ncbi:unnamed protein product [Soboliphyme baturini]|uniref:NTP_transferase domain-containing protein n=1 Tax=Soboliphyme baturini TaxID=241478 RepID=A0A183JB46_9BILA|nr:unnamed protein product [Soboliphyme baturini]